MSTKPFTFPVQPPNVTPPAQNVQPPPCAVPPVAVQVNDKTSTAANHQYAYANNVLTISDGNTPPPPDGIKIGDTVAATVTPTNIRPSPAGNPVLGTVNAGTQGKVVAGPTQANGFAWWQVAFPNNLTGWVGFDSLVVVNPNPPITVGASFPGAQGSGAAAVGARSSTAKVIEVTNLNDTGAGSLRAALAASGPRYAVFRVPGGIIANKSRMTIGNPYCTLVGRTCPGEIVLGGQGQSGESLFISTHDVVVRDISYDGSASTATGPDTGTVGFELASGAVQNVIFDHLSARWWGNKGWILYANGQAITDVSMQFSLMYEPNFEHPVGPMTDASSLAEDCVDLDFHHNLFVNMGHRIPLYNTKRGRWASNLIYNWDYFASLFQGGVNADLIGNKYVRGNLNDGNSNPHPFQFSPVQSTDDTTQKMPGPGSFYLVGNYSDQYQTNPAGDQTVMCAKLNGEGTPELGPPPASWYRSSPLAVIPYPIVSEDLSKNINALDEVLLAGVGNCIRLNADGSFNIQPSTQDARVLAQYVAKGSGGEYLSPSYNGPKVAPPPATGTLYESSQHDGIADAWKQKWNLSTTDPALFNKISPNTGLPYIECFLGGIAP